MTTISTVPTNTTLEALGLQRGDTVIVNDVDGGQATLSLARHTARPSRKLSTRQFLDKWAGKFPVPGNPDNDPRLAHILEKHVK